MEEKALDYFASINPLARKIVHETRLAKHILNEEWDELEWKKQEEALDDFFVDRSVREKYISSTKDNHYAMSFPKLYIQSGEKIIVDMDSDIWSWQDVHSAPFSWKSKSQQDLNLLDLDPEKLSKPQPSKGTGKSKSGQDNEERPTAPPEFVYNPDPSIWESNKYKNWKADPNNFILPETNDHSSYGNVRNSCVSDVSQPSLTESKHSEDQEGETSQMAPQPAKKPPKKASTKSPVATRLKLSSSFSKRRQEEEQELVTDELSRKEFPKAHKDIESNVFDNPVMNIREQNLMDEETESISSTTSSPSRKPLLKEPRAQMMEREEQTELFDGAKRTLELAEDQAGLLEVTESHASVLSGPDVVVLRDSEVSGERPTSSVPMTGFTFLDNW